MSINKRHIFLYILMGIAVLLPYLGALWLHGWYSNKVEQIKNARFVIIDKSTMTLSVYDYQGKSIMQAPIACGKAYGDKRRIGDMRTPEGIFHISSIEDASSWTHDFGDGNGDIEGAYGPMFIRLDCPGHKGIGIHGTHLPESLGSRASEGCIRLDNKDLLKLSKFVHSGMVVAVLPSQQDVNVNNIN